MTPLGACILSCDGPRLRPDEVAFFREAQPVGFILFARHIETPDQVRALCADLRKAVGRDCFITTDQEGGRVQRLRGPTWREWRPAWDHVQAASDPERAMYLRARLIADELTALGLDSVCAPVLDIARDGTHPFLKNRCYGADAETVARLGRAVARGHLDGGVLPVMKHMPGHGRATQDTHFELPRVAADLAQLDASDFLPFRRLRDLPVGMTGHIVFEAFEDRAATVSPAMVQVIRQVIGFEGLLMTDDISMEALDGDLKHRARAAIAAGCDLVLHCNDTFEDRVAIADASGPVSDQAMARIHAVEAARRTPDEIDIPAIEAELASLLGGQVYV